jgi:predicted permease
MGVALALPAAWFYLRHSGTAIRPETRGATSGRTARTLRETFVVAQIALAFVLLAGAGLLGLSLQRVMAVSPGFQSDHVLTGQISLIGDKYPAPSTGLVFSERLVEELSQQPGVLSAGIVNNVPFSGSSGKSAAKVIGHVLRPGESPHGHYSYGVGGDYFRAMGFSLREGRFLTGADSRRRERVCVVDEDFAHYYWPGRSALGQRLFQGSEAGPEAEAFTVVGVVRSIKQAGLTEESGQGAIYYPYIYRADNNIFVATRGSVRPESLRMALERVVRSIDPELAINDVRSMDDRIADSLIARRSPALLAGLFSAIALLLTGIGTYGVLSYAVSQRRREIGVRMALGAQPGRIRAEFLTLTGRLFLGGAVLGGFGAWLTGKVMQDVLFHVPALSVWALGSAAVIMALVSLFACLLPAQRAARISPMQALAE